MSKVVHMSSKAKVLWCTHRPKEETAVNLPLHGRTAVSIYRHRWLKGYHICRVGEKPTNYIWEVIIVRCPSYNYEMVMYESTDMMTTKKYAQFRCHI